MSDYRSTFATPHVAHSSLRGLLDAPAYSDGTPARVAVGLTDLCVSPAGARDRQVIYGDRVTVLETQEGWSYIRGEKDGFCGHVRSETLGPDWQATHWVSAPASHLYPEPSLKVPFRHALTLGSQLALKPGEGRFAETADGLFIARAHVRPLSDRPTDPATIAELFVGTPYVWGGNSRAGIDCSGLVQAAFLACGLPCPGDSDQQWQALGQHLAPDAAFRRNDLFFWKGHVALALDTARLIHANGAAAAVSVEGIDSCLARIREAEGDSFLGVKRCGLRNWAGA